MKEAARLGGLEFCDGERRVEPATKRPCLRLARDNLAKSIPIRCDYYQVRFDALKEWHLIPFASACRSAYSNLVAYAKGVSRENDCGVP
jgi:hypothetical protein